MMPRLITKSNVFMPRLSACGARACPPFTRLDVKLSRRAEKFGELDPLDQPGCPGRQGVEYPLHVAAEIVFSGLDFHDKAGRFLDQRRRDDRQRQDAPSRR